MGASNLAPAYGVRPACWRFCNSLATNVRSFTISAVQPIAPKPPQSFSIKGEGFANSQQPSMPKDWPHAPVHRLSENGIYIVTAGTLHKKRLFDSPGRLDLMERLLLSQAK